MSARDILASRSNGWAVDFTDNTMQIRDTITAANRYNGPPFGKLTFTRASAAYYFNGQFYRSAAVNEPRINTSLSGVIYGLMIETARQNDCLRSNDLGNVLWTLTGLTVSNDYTGPDGVIDSASRIRQVGAGTSTVLQTITKASALNVTSCLMKRIAGTGIIEVTQDNITFINVTAQVNANPGGWAWVKIPAQTIANPVVGIRLNANGDQVAVWCFQTETGADATSPMPTVAVPTTRALDACSMLTTSFNHNANAWSLYAAGSNFDAATDAAARTIVSLSDNTVANFSTMGRPASSAVLRADLQTTSVNQAALTGGTLLSGVLFRQACGVALNDVAYSGNGSVISADTLATMPLVTNFIIGANRSNVNVWNGHIAQIMHQPSRVSNAELQRLSIGNFGNTVRIAAENNWRKFEQPFWNALPLTLSDSTINDLTVPIMSAVWAPGAGTVSVQMAGNEPATPISATIPNARLLNGRVVRVYATGTTAGAYVGLHSGPISA